MSTIRQVCAVLIGIACAASVPTVTAAQAATFQLGNLARMENATGTPRPGSGLHSKLGALGSYVETTVSGSGRVVVGVIGSYCGGYPSVQAQVDGRVVGTQSIVDSHSYGSHLFGSSVADGSHRVRLTMINDINQPGICDSNAYVSSINMESGVASVRAPSGVKPGSSNTGVPSGTVLQVHQGDLTITQPGTVVDALDIRGVVRIQADNVTLKRSIVRGGPASAASQALVAAWWNAKNFVIQDSTLAATNPTINLDGLSGSGITARRLNISRVVDTVKVIGSNVSVSDSWLHGNLHSDNDLNQSDGKTHDDNVQIEGGSNIRITGNTMEGSYNAAVMVTQNVSKTSDFILESNWLQGGACTVNVTERSRGGSIYGMAVRNNRFGVSRYGSTCPMRLPSSSPISVTSNIWDSTLKQALPTYF